MSDVEDVAHAVRFEAASLKDLVQRLVAALKSEQGAMLKLARLPALEAENETLRANFKKLQDESDRRFEQANADNLRLGEVWQSEKRRLESEVARTRDMVTTERENASRIRERMSTLAEELRAEALLTGRQADAAQTEQVRQCRAPPLLSAVGGWGGEGLAGPAQCAATALVYLARASMPAGSALRAV